MEMLRVLFRRLVAQVEPLEMERQVVLLELLRLLGKQERMAQGVVEVGLERLLLRWLVREVWELKVPGMLRMDREVAVEVEDRNLLLGIVVVQGDCMGVVVAVWAGPTQLAVRLVELEDRV